MLFSAISFSLQLASVAWKLAVEGSFTCCSTPLLPVRPVVSCGAAIDRNLSPGSPMVPRAGWAGTRLWVASVLLCGMDRAIIISEGPFHLRRRGFHSACCSRARSAAPPS
jgi:hypothetical protein